MSKKILLIVLAVAVVGLGAYAFLGKSRQAAAPVFNPLNATYIIEGQPVTLTDGKAATQAAPGSAAMIATAVFGEPASGDLNGDGMPDAALILVQDPGGSGIFYYAAAAINASGTAQGTNAVLLGDRVAPQNIQIQNGQIVVNYADRNAGESMATPPSVGVTKYLIYRGSVLEATLPVAGLGEHCGGNMTTAAVCGTGYRCAPAAGSHLPFGDVGGTCVPD